MTRFFICETCGNIVGLVQDSGGTLTCCGKSMKHLEANTVEASQEKHLPHVTKTEEGLEVKVGSVPHPQGSDHHIRFIYVQTQKGGRRVNLELDCPPQASFNCFSDNDKPLAVFAYCNLHGMWKTEL